jgi:hypothetical protein
MELPDLIHSLENRIEEIQTLITENMPSKGDKEEDCQRLCLLNRLSDFEHTVNGTTMKDLIEEVAV